MYSIYAVYRHAVYASHLSKRTCEEPPGRVGPRHQQPWNPSLISASDGQSMHGCSSFSEEQNVCLCVSEDQSEADFGSE